MGSSGAIDLPLSHLLAATGALVQGGSRPERFEQVVVDSRQAGPGTLFVALRGEQVDGHDFVAQAFAQGAAAALVERPPRGVSEGGAAGLLILVDDTYRALQDLGRYWRDRLEPELVVGITGSVGKTTTKEMVAHLLGHRFRVLKSEGNLNTEVGLPLTLLRAGPVHDALVLEMGMFVSGDIRLLADIARPNVGVVTNVQPVHLERLGTIEAIQSAKQELVEALGMEQTAVLNYDDPLVRAMADATPAEIVSYGLSDETIVGASDLVGQGLEGVRFTLRVEDWTRVVRMPQPGLHSVQAALAAVGVGLSAGIPPAEMADRLEQPGPPSRMLVRPGIEGSRILDDTYNASPESMRAALRLLSELEGRKVAVLGDMFELGSFEEEGHRLVGDLAGDVAEVLVTVGTRARWIAEQARLAPRPPATIEAVDDQPAAIALLRALLRPGDNILIKGSRGMQMDRLAQALVAAQEP